MKYDMCGAASVMGVLRACAEMKLPINVVGVMAACENMPGSAAMKPGEVVRSLSGKTIEVLNTDAEGRLILCDALTYTQRRFAPCLTIDIATLTGACVVALGNVRSGLYANDDVLASRLLEAGNKTCDRAWRMPLDEDYHEQLKSPVADVANLGGRPAGSVTAACFLAGFVEGKWAHLDVAGTAWKGGAQKGGTGRPVALLAQFLIDASTTT
jgi:leucyl aminopeptidase